MTDTGMTLWAVLLASLAGSVHCAAMCGPLAAITGRGRSPLRQVGYHGGRLATYVAAGTVAGTVGRAADLALWSVTGARVAAIAAGLLLVVIGIVGLMRLAGFRVSTRRDPLHGAAGAVIARVHRVPAAWRSTVLGVATGLLPCGWLYAFLAVAAGTASPVGGAVSMAVFWSGTVPAVAGAALFLHRLTGRLRRRLPALGAIALILIGLITAFRGTSHASHHPRTRPVALEHHDRAP